MNLNDIITITEEHIHLLTKEQAWHYRILPKSRKAGRFTLYCDHTANTAEFLSELEILFGTEVELDLIGADEVSRLLSKYYIRDEAGSRQAESRHDGVDFLAELIRETKNLRSSDIHIESYDQKCRVRIRIDGMLVERYLLQKDEYPALVNKIKISANMDIAEKRLPQDGRIHFKADGQEFDIRVSVLPTLYQEKIVLRLLSNDATNIELGSLGFSETDLENYREGIMHQNGIVLISGPTGSGKTTTLYATLKSLNKITRNILTVEDPIEYTLEGINQVQVKESIGLDFASALRTFLRQDPDVIMVGEIRDTETANMAIRAALTGHLVLSTIHTNSAWATVSRLIDMGIEPFLVAGTLKTSVAQRLVRLLCPHCKSEEPFDNVHYPKSFRPFRAVSRHFVAKGCERCHYTGYKGRKAIYEVVPIDDGLAHAIRDSKADVHSEFQERGIHTLAENAFVFFEHGLTSLEEIYPLLFNH